MTFFLSSIPAPARGRGGEAGQGGAADQAGGGDKRGGVGTHRADAAEGQDPLIQC